MSLLESRGQLSKAMKDLVTRWAEVRSNWMDAQADNFEKTYLVQIESETRKALAAMDHMNVVLQKVEKDCE